MAQGTMKLIDPYTGKMECRVCGAVHWANIRLGGFYYRGSWQCVERASHPVEPAPSDEALGVPVTERLG